jgi:hypothetical protein
MTNKKLEEKLMDGQVIWSVARALYENRERPGNCGWNGLVSDQREFWRTNARGAIRTALQEARKL